MTKGEYFSRLMGLPFKNIPKPAAKRNTSYRFVHLSLSLGDKPVSLDVKSPRLVLCPAYSNSPGGNDLEFGSMIQVFSDEKS